MVGVIDQIKNRLDILQQQAPLVPIVKYRAEVAPMEKPPAEATVSTNNRITFPERTTRALVSDIEPVQRTMDIQEIGDTFKPQGPQTTNKRATEVFKRRK